MMTGYTHKPVMIHEVIHYLKPVAGETYLDCTYGRGGYSQAILDSADCQLVATDRDTDAQHHAQTFAAGYPRRFRFVSSRFSELLTNLKAQNIFQFHGIVADLGVSSPQLDNPEKGFSFMNDGPLDMQMGRDDLRAVDVVNEYSESEIVDILRTYGEEKFARRIARAIIDARTTEPIRTTLQLAEIVKGAVPFYEKRIHPATRTFQALRIHVNRELDEIAALLEQALELLAPMGRLVIVAFHSLEDRIVKNFFTNHSDKIAHRNKYLSSEIDVQSPLMILTRKPIVPSADEVKTNPRSRSAKLRAALRTSYNMVGAIMLSFSSWDKISSAGKLL